MNSVPGKSDYRVKLDGFYDELINQIDVFVESNIQINKSNFIESMLLKKRDDLIAALNQDRNSSLLRIDQLYDEKAQEAEKNDDIVLISDQDLFNHTTLILFLDHQYIQLGVVRLVDKWLGKEQVDLFKLLFVQGPPESGYFTNKQEIQAYMDKFFSNYKFKVGSIITVDHAAFEKRLYNRVYETNGIVEIKTSEFMNVERLNLSQPMGHNSLPVLARPEACFLFEYVEQIFISFYPETMIDADLVKQILASFEFKKQPIIDVSYRVLGNEINLQDSKCFNNFTGQPINKMVLELKTSLLTDRLFVGLDRLDTLEFGNKSTLYSFDIEILRHLTNLRKLKLSDMQVDLNNKPFSSNKLLEELLLENCKFIKNQINPSIFTQLQGLKRLRFVRTIFKDETDFTLNFGSLVHNNVQSLEILGYNMTKVDESLFTGLSSLTELIIQHDEIKSISGLHNTSKLESLNLTGNFKLSDLNFLTPLLSNRLVSLTLSYTCVKSVAFLANLDLSNLRTLDLDNNELDSNVTVDASKMTCLESLSLDICTLSRIPFTGTLPSLKKLGLSKNKFKQMSKEVFADLDMPNLVNLDVCYNPVESVQPEAFVSMSKLEVLILEPVLLGITSRFYEWPSEKLSLLNGLTSLREIRPWTGMETMKLKIFVSTLNKYVWVITL